MPCKVCPSCGDTKDCDMEMCERCEMGLESLISPEGRVSKIDMEEL